MSPADPASLYDIEATALDGTVVRLDTYRGRTLLIVNVASRCGFTPQYEGLERLWKTYRNRGLVVLGFPCDQFGHQEPGDEAAIRQFCSTTYQVTFPMFSKVEVNGPRAHPLYRFLKSARRGVFGLQAIRWNFTKFLVRKDGEVVRRFAPRDTPTRIESEIVALLD